MDFRLSGEQELLRDGARRYFSSVDDTRDDWTQFEQLGWLAMALPEALGGLGSPLEDIAILSEEMGRGLSPAPFIGAALLPLRIIERCDVFVDRQMLLSAIAGNRSRLALAAAETGRRYSLMPGTNAVWRDGEYRLTGRKSLVIGGGQATRLIVSACIENDGDHGIAPALFLVDIDQAGVTRRSYQTLDEVPVADFIFDDVVVTPEHLLAGAGSALIILEDALDEAIICLCAESLGGMDRAIELTAAYLKIRKQFGRPLAEFQVLQHAMAEMAIEADAARSMLYRAIAAVKAPRSERQKAVSACSIKLMQAAKWVTGQAVHLHGGIGMTCEYPVGHYLRRVIVAERMFGDREFHLARFLA